jgi:hypothetical protein
MLRAMEVQLLYFDGCPNWRLVESRLREALTATGVDPLDLVVTQVTTPEEADRLGFRGSPTILVNGHDSFAGPDAPVGLSCRLYPRADGTDHAPTVEQLRSALASADAGRNARVLRHSRTSGVRPQRTTHGANDPVPRA